MPDEPMTDAAEDQAATEATEATTEAVDETFDEFLAEFDRIVDEASDPVLYDLVLRLSDMPTVARMLEGLSAYLCESPAEVIVRGLALFQLAMLADQSGGRMAFVDDEGNIVREVTLPRPAED